MSEHISIVRLYPSAVPPGAVRKPVSSGTCLPPADKRSFRDIFEENIVRFSSHAELRLAQRGIRLQPEQLAKIESAVDKAAAKGAKDSLILLGDMAFIINVKNRTVVTAMDGSTMNDHVFTQIDSAVIIS